MIFSLLQILIPDIIFLTGIWLIVARDKSLRLIIAGATVSAFILSILFGIMGIDIPVVVSLILSIGSVCSHIAFYIVCFTSRFAGTKSRLVHASFYLYAIYYGIYFGIYYGRSGSSSTFSYLSFALIILRLITYLLLLCAGIRAKKITEKYLERAEELFLTGEQYLSGAGAEKDFVKAADCFRKSAKLGHAEACNELGICYQRGDGVEKDNKKAAYWYKKGAGWGHDLAQYNLADCYREGIGVKKNAQKAEHWYNKSGLSQDDSSVYRIQPQKTPAVNTIDKNKVKSTDSAQPIATPKLKKEAQNPYHGTSFNIVPVRKQDMQNIRGTARNAVITCCEAAIDKQAKMLKILCLIFIAIMLPLIILTLVNSTSDSAGLLIMYIVFGLIFLMLFAVKVDNLFKGHALLGGNKSYKPLSSGLSAILAAPIKIVLEALSIMVRFDVPDKIDLPRLAFPKNCCAHLVDKGKLLNKVDWNYLGAQISQYAAEVDYYNTVNRTKTERKDLEEIAKDSSVDSYELKKAVESVNWDAERAKTALENSESSLQRAVNRREDNHLE